MNRFSLKKKIPIKTWNGIAPDYVHVKGDHKHINGRQLNLLITKSYARAESIILRAEQEETHLTFAQFKSAYLNHTSLDFFDWFEEYLEYKIKRGIQDATLIKYKSQYRKLKTFRPTINIHEVTERFVIDYDHWMRSERANGHNTRYKSLMHLKSVLDFARRNGVRILDPFEHYEVKAFYKQKDFLTFEEVEKLHKLYRSGALRDSWSKALRVFLFACYTGISYSDVCNLQYSDIHLLNEQDLYIKYDRNKTGNKSLALLYSAALELVGDIPSDESLKSCEIFDPYANQYINRLLKSIMEAVGLKKQITFHTARHTCGHLMIMNGTPRHLIKEVLGHSKESMTAHYSRITDEEVISQLKKYTK